jgi:hypothetical protein
LGKILDEIEKAASGRHTVVHSRWGTCDDNDDALVRLPTFGTNEVWVKADFDKVIDRLHAVRTSIFKFPGPPGF